MGPPRGSGPNEAHLRDDGAVRVTWPRAEGRPFQLSAVYRWRDAATLDVETYVTAAEPLTDFESFLAVYCAPYLAAPYVHTGAGAQDPSGFLPAPQAAGDWQVFPRGDDALAIIQDTRWDMPPHPVAWSVRPCFDKALAFRRGDDGPATVLMAPRDDCFALMTPCAGEAHYSLYLSLFGCDLSPGQTVKALARLVISDENSPEAITALYDHFEADFRN